MKTLRQLFLLSLIFLFGNSVYGQACEAYYPLKEGAMMEMTSYNAKGKIEGRSNQTVKEVKRNGDNLELTVRSQYYDDKDKMLFDKDISMKCEGGIFKMDMENFMDPSMTEQFKDMEVEVSEIDLEYPAALSQGQMLKDGNMKIGVKSAGMALMNMEVLISDRKVEIRESITTPAGTFDCYKISYNITTRSMFKTTVKAEEWMAKDVGTVKTVSYDKNGKMEGYSELTKFKN
jgi:hypothetical protein